MGSQGGRSEGEGARTTTRLRTEDSPRLPKIGEDEGVKPASPTQLRRPRQTTLVLCALLLCAAPALATPPSRAHGAEPFASRSASPSPSFTPPPYGGEQDLSLIPNVVDVWTQPSIAPGQLLHLHISSPTPNYSVTIRRETFAGPTAPAVVFQEDRTDGADHRSLTTWNATTATARAAWPVALSLDSTGWPPGVYTIQTDNGTTSQIGRGIFVVRSPNIVSNRPLYALSILTFQAYNTWGGASAYSQPRSARLSLERPYLNLNDYNHGWPAEASWAIWMSAHVTGLQYTTDYDLSLASPAVNPSALILGQHTEYISKVFRDWLDRASGDRGGMEIANFGVNSLYWQVRLEGGIESGSPKEIVTYKYRGQDPFEINRRREVSFLFRSLEIGRPEGALLGVQYAGASGVRLPPTSLIIHRSIPRRFLAGTPLRPGSKLLNLYSLEADSIYPAARPTILGSAFITLSPKKTTTLATVIRTGKRGARIFSAGSLAWVTGFTGTQPFGISRASFIRFNANILDWLGIKRH